MLTKHWQAPKKKAKHNLTKQWHAPKNKKSKTPASTQDSGLPQIVFSFLVPANVLLDCAFSLCLPVFGKINATKHWQAPKKTKRTTTRCTKRWQASKKAKKAKSQHLLRTGPHRLNLLLFCCLPMFCEIVLWFFCFFCFFWCLPSHAEHIGIFLCSFSLKITSPWSLVLYVYWQKTMRQRSWKCWWSLMLS